MDKKKGQQELVGFVLIVALVVVGLMVFLVISLRDKGESDDSLGVGNMLDAVMKHTTECAIVSEPNYDNFEDLFRSCHLFIVFDYFIFAIVFIVIKQWN